EDMTKYLWDNIKQQLSTKSEKAREEVEVNDNSIDNEDKTTPLPQTPLPKNSIQDWGLCEVLSRVKVGNNVKYIGETDLMKGEIIDLELGTNIFA
ncbi:hypothetical protein RFI_30752, partial [Reticulomyxa filosa]